MRSLSSELLFMSSRKPLNLARPQYTYVSSGGNSYLVGSYEMKSHNSMTESH
jgi:hypothetical protein